MSGRFGLLGEKLGHSFSPMIHGYLGDYGYELFEVDADGLDAFMKRGRFDGINVTIPYKQAVIPYCATLSGEARKTGSVNTIVRGADGLLHGHNTDCFGFRFMLERGNINPSAKKALVLGSGGSARTVRAVLDDMGAREAVVISRGGEDNYGNLDRHRDAVVVVNTTPVGMYPNNGCSPLPLIQFERLRGVADLIYNPMRTKLLLDAERLGIPCVNGLAMLTAQAWAASRLFLGSPGRADEALINRICREIINKMRNIALIGMPGCGKSSVGEILARFTGRQFSDLDDLIASAAGKPVPDIINDDGEEAFRQLETRILGDESKKSGAVLATGGGVPARPENLDLLRQNSLIVYLRRGLTELAGDGRPLSQSVGVRELARRRLHLYEAWSDLTVDAQAGPEQTAMKIIEAADKYNEGG